MPSRDRAIGAARGGTQEDIRRHNLATLLTQLHECGSLSRAELTARMGLNRSTIAALVTELVALGAVSEERPGGGRPAAGRPSLMVRPRAEHVQVLAADVGVDRVVVALVGIGGTVVARRQRRLGTAIGPRPAARLITRLVDGVLTDAAAGPLVVGMGVSIPGVVRRSDGCVRFAPNLGWVDQPFGSLLGESLGRGSRWRAPLGRLALEVGNDADLGLLAEHRRGVARGVDEVVFVAGDVGVGGGLIVAGRPLRGAGGYAGELGHMVVRPDGRLCRCGARGCWETEIGTRAVARAIGLDEGAGREQIARALRSVPPGSPLLEEVGGYLGVGLASIINMINPQLIIVGGVLRQVLPLAEAAVLRALDARALAAPAEQVQLALPHLGGDAVLLGAAELAWSRVLADPAATLGPGLSVGAGSMGL